MSNRTKLLILFILTIASILFFLLFKLGLHWEYLLTSWDQFTDDVAYAFRNRSNKILAMTIAGTAIAFSTVIFQTVTHNRILTPSIIGLDWLFLLVQTLLIFFLGGKNYAMISNEWMFLISIGTLVAFSIILFKIMLGKEGRSVYFLLLMGIIMGALFNSLSTFMQVLIDPNEFLLAQDKMFASFNNVQVKLLWWALGILIATIAIFFPLIRYLDVLSLGRDQSVNLGISYQRVVQITLIIVAILTALSTALVGPITFLGLLVVNVTYEIFKTYKHSILITGSIFVSIISLAIGQLIVERVFTFSTTLSVIINFIGGIYFIYLLLRGSK
ncbi:iron chelate uptake ABC transporter family permease subunit [Wohlfahrtiimonas larvae]|uniref:Petrobactin ABC transporter permease YclO n=3 Tax=Wohlfahrtiimonas larvae TaxID=1157986 RepID=A0ABP9MEQ3_9GAMM